MFIIVDIGLKMFEKELDVLSTDDLLFCLLWDL